jgi:hypothetical protein
MIKILQMLFCARQSSPKKEIDKRIESPLLQLQEYNIDVWELVMIELVKARKKKVLNEMDELWNYWRSSKVEIFSQHQPPGYRTFHRGENERRFKKVINPGRIIIEIIKGKRQYPDFLRGLEEQKKNILIHATYKIPIWFPSEGRYFVYGFDLHPANNPERGQMLLRYSYENKPQFILRPLEILSKLNNFEFNINAYTPNHEIVKFLYEREKEMEIDEHIYCIVKNEIIPYYEDV